MFILSSAFMRTVQANNFSHDCGFVLKVMYEVEGNVLRPRSGMEVGCCEVARVVGALRLRRIFECAVWDVVSFPLTRVFW